MKTMLEITNKHNKQYPVVSCYTCGKAWQHTHLSICSSCRNLLGSWSLRIPKTHFTNSRI